MRIPEKVLCDIDGVLADTAVAVIAAINREHGTAYRSEDWSSWEWPIERMAVLAGLDVPAAASWLFSIQHLAAAPPIPEAQRVLREWMERGTQVDVATSRPVDQRDMTFDWLAQHYPFINPKNIAIRTDNSLKGPAFKQQRAEIIKPELYFEDEAAMMKSLIAVWPENMLAILRMIDQPWNRGFRELDAYRTNWGSLR